MARIYGGRWKFIDSLGAGGQGDVFRVTDLTGEHSGEYALKRVLNPRRRDRFLNEVEAIKRLRHPNVIPLVDHSALGDDSGDEKQYIVMPIAQQGDLQRRVALYKDSLDGVVIVAAKMASALSEAHRLGIIHRDIKPANILFRNEDNDVWISDFGICLISDRGRPTEHGEVVGPWMFAAPELEEGGPLGVTPSADIYSLGKVIYYMLTGGRILPRERLNERNYSDVFSRGGRLSYLRQLLGRMICPIDTRLQSMELVVRELNEIRNWDLRTGSSLLKASSLLIVESLREKEIQQFAVDEQRQRAHEFSSQVVRSAVDAFGAWIVPALQSTASAIANGTTLNTGVQELEIQHRSHMPLLPGERINLIWGVAFHHMNKSERGRKHVLNYYIGRRSTGREIHNAEESLPLIDTDPKLILIPYYQQLESDGASAQYLKFQGFLSEERAARDRGPHEPLVTTSYYGSGRTLRLEFVASEFSSANREISDFVSKCLEIFFKHLATGANGVGA